MLEVIVELGLEAGIFPRGLIGALDLEHQRHQRLGDEAAAIEAVKPALVGPAAEGIGGRSKAQIRLAWARNSRILAGSLTPGRVSTPDETSTALAPEMRTASARLPAWRPPDSIQGKGQRRACSNSQSKASALPPGRVASRGGRASNISQSASPK